MKTPPSAAPVGRVGSGRGGGWALLQLESGGRRGLQPPQSVAMEKGLDGFLQLCRCLPHTLGDKRGLEVANEQL